MAKFRVLRRHDGDKEYHEGDERILSKADAKHLVDLGVLEVVEDDEAPEGEKAEKVPANKAEKAAPKNKADN